MSGILWLLVGLVVGWAAKPVIDKVVSKPKSGGGPGEEQNPPGP